MKSAASPTDRATGPKVQVRRKIGEILIAAGLIDPDHLAQAIKMQKAQGKKLGQVLVDMGVKDVGFGMTVQEMNAEDLVELYNLSNHMGMEFATATLHNSFYFRKTNNTVENKQKVAKAFEELINRLLKSRSPKKWFRAYFNHGLINYLYGQKRLLPCDMGKNGFFLDPFGDLLPCNGMTEKMSMGNLHKQDFASIWHSDRAEEVRRAVKHCDKNCWMIGSAAPAMRDKLGVPLSWVAKHKLKGKYSLDENSFIK